MFLQRRKLRDATKHDFVRFKPEYIDFLKNFSPDKWDGSYCKFLEESDYQPTQRNARWFQKIYKTPVSIHKAAYDIMYVNASMGSLLSLKPIKIQNDDYKGILLTKAYKDKNETLIIDAENVTLLSRDYVIKECLKENPGLYNSLKKLFVSLKNNINPSWDSPVVVN